MKELNPELVTDERSFLAFAALLHDDLRASMERERSSPSNPYGPAAGGWENITLDAFLDGAIDWAESSKNTCRTAGMANPWQFFAYFLLAGKTYE